MALNHNNVTKVYSSVIEEVIKNVREPFLNDGVDEQVLQELKQIWQSKVSQSRAIETKEQKTHLPVAYVARQPQPTAQPQMTRQQPVATTAPTETLTAPQTQQYIPTIPNTAQFITPHFTQILMPGSSTPVQRFISDGSKGNLPPLHVRPAYHGMPTIQPVRTQQPLQTAVTQRGTTQQSLQTAVTQRGTTQQSLQTAVTQHGTIQQSLQTAVTQRGTTQQSSARPSVIRTFQVDGPNDSDSEDDDDDDDFSGFGMDNDELEEKAVEDSEDPLNSADDGSDEEDPSDLFDTENVVVCQFDRITRSKNKWKFHLKDGIMNLNGKDYVFQRANGEAEW